MKALVTGATGFMGSSLTRELLKDGVEVRVLVRKNSDTRNIDGLDVEKVYGDIRDGDSVKAALKGSDTFYQTAGLFAYWGPSKKEFYDINVEGTKIALNAAFEQGVGKVVYTSSIAAIGAHGVDSPANEESQFNMWKSGVHYIISKYLGEVEALKICKKGLPLVVVNPTLAIGVRDIKPVPSGQTILDILNGRMIGYVESGTNVVDVEDVARGHILAAQKGRIGERYILGNENLPMGKYFALVAEVGGVKPPTRKLPRNLALATSYALQLGAFISKKPPIVTPAMVRSFSQYWYFDCSKAVKELGFLQTPIRNTIEKAVNWFRENGYVKKV
jgi:dihydroflavonol-4-reductase